jgi:NAD(P)H-hydrate repair Nnr-like enzyme with NAD(P)H-hydrate dehydratase domain
VQCELISNPRDWGYRRRTDDHRNHKSDHGSILVIGRSTVPTSGYAFQHLRAFINLLCAPVPQVCPTR